MTGFPASNDGQRFARAILEFAYGLTHDDAINANSCDGSYDRGLDAYFSDNDYFYLMQFKYHENPFGEKVDFSASGAGQQLVHCWPYVSSLGLASAELRAKRIRDELYDAAVAYRDEVELGAKKVKLVVVEWADGDASDAVRSGQVWLSQLPRPHHVESFEVENFHSIYKRWLDKKFPATRYDGEVSIKYIGTEGTIELNVPHQAIVVQVTGAQLVHLYEAVGENLFDPNVRFELVKSKFNEHISETAEKEPNNFWYYNNGVTIICKDFRHADSNVLQVVSPGVVNGGQTIKRLLEAEKDQGGQLSDSIKVLVRVIKSDNAGFDRSVALYTNSQNPITLRDLASNRIEQSQYQIDFAKLKIPWFYERKRGAWDIAEPSDRGRFLALSSGKGRKRERRLSNEAVGKAVLAFSLQEPVIAKTSTPAIWNESPYGYYAEIFCRGRSVYELAVASLVYQVLNGARERNTFAKLTMGVGTVEEIKDCIPHLTAIVGYLVKEKYRQLSRAELRKMYDDLVDPKTEYVSEDNFVTRLFSKVLYPFVLWYNNSRRGAVQAMGATWESSNWYKSPENWNKKDNVATMIPAFELYRGFTPPARPDATADLIP
jgi:hypothetical protein